jgi:soluble epoxide hydrolase / lipid-phosphate phosphatase
MFPTNNTIWRDHLAPIGGCRAWLNADIQTEDPPYLDDDFKAEWMASMRQTDAIDAGLNCYRAQLNGVNDADDALLTEEDWALNIPVLGIGGSEDFLVRPEFLYQSIEPWSRAGFERKTLESGHWVMHEAADEFSQILLDFGS